jgi:hypothetical protein
VATRNAATTAEIASAYTASANGDIINLTGTDYGVNGEWSSPTGTKTVTFQGQGATVTKFGMLNIRSSNSTWLDIGARIVTDFKFTDTAGGQGTGVTLRRVNVLMEYRTSTNGSNWIIPEPWPYGALTIDGAGNAGWELYDCIVGDTINAKGCQLTANDVLFDHCTFRNCFINNQGRNVGSGEEVHLEGIQVVGCSFITFRRCTWVRNNVMDVMFTNYGSSPPTTDITIENCVFAHSTEARNLTEGLADTWHSSTPVLINFLAPNAQPGTLTNWVVRNNTFETSVGAIGQNAVNSKWVGNVGGWPNFGAGMTYRYNVGTKIHSTDTAVTPNSSSKGSPAPFGWVDSTSPAYNFHLASNSVCRDKGSPTDFPATDLDGVARA